MGGIVRWLKNCDKGEPRELAGEPINGSGWIFGLCRKHGGKGQKYKGAAMRRTEERKRHDSLARHEQPVGRTTLFYAFKIQLKNKNVLDGLAWLLPTSDDEYRFPGCIRLMGGLIGANF